MTSNKKDLQSIGQFSLVMCERGAAKRSITGKKECNLLPIGTDIHSRKEQDEKIIRKDVMKADIDCPAMRKQSATYNNKNMVAVVDTLECSVDSIAKPNFLSCKCLLKKVVPALSNKIGNEIKRIEVFNELETGKEQLDQTVVISDLGNDVTIKSNKDGHEIGSKDFTFQIGHNTDVEVGTCGAKTTFTSNFRKPHLSDLLLMPIDATLYLIGKLGRAKMDTSYWFGHEIKMEPSSFLPTDPHDIYYNKENNNGIACAFTFRKGSRDIWTVKNDLLRVNCFGKACLDKAIQAYENSGTVRREIINKETGKKKIYSVVKEHVNFLPDDVMKEIGEGP